VCFFKRDNISSGYHVFALHCDQINTVQDYLAANTYKLDLSTEYHKCNILRCKHSCHMMVLKKAFPMSEES